MSGPVEIRAKLTDSVSKRQSQTVATKILKAKAQLHTEKSTPRNGKESFSVMYDARFEQNASDINGEEILQ
jgi:hypothetical protein